MDTLNFEPRSFHSSQVERMFSKQDGAPIDDMNLSDLEVFMLRGRRMQARAIGGELRSIFAKLAKLWRGDHQDRTGDGGCHNPA